MLDMVGHNLWLGVFPVAHPNKSGTSAIFVHCREVVIERLQHNRKADIWELQEFYCILNGVSYFLLCSE